MYPLNNTAKTLFQNYRQQTAKIQFAGSKETRILTESDIMQNSLSVDRYCTSGDQIEIGSAIAAELTVKLDNRDGKFDDLELEGAELYVVLGMRDSTETIPLGYFTVDESPRKRSIIEITALDRMMKFDQLADPSKFPKGASVGAYIQICCSACGIVLHTSLSRLPNITHAVETFPEKDDITYRQILQWCAALTGTCAYIDWNGELRLEWYTDNVTGETISTSERYVSDILENDIVISGVIAQDDDENEYIAGNDSYAIGLEDNPLIQSGYEEVVTALYGKIGGFTYRPYSCETKPMPHLYPLDTIVFVDKKGTRHTTIITNATFTMNAHTKFEGRGETSTKNKYHTPSLTAQQSRILERLKKQTEQRVSESEQNALHLNEMIANALGLYCTTYRNEDGSISYYYHNKPTLEESNIIYTFNAGGFAWTTAWNGGKPVWQYGITSSGNAILNYLTVNKLTADHINVESLVASGMVSATKGVIGGFVIGEESLTNENGGSSISIIEEGYRTQFWGGGIYHTKQESAGGQTVTSGFSLTASEIYLSGVVSGTRTGIDILTSYEKRRNYDAYDGRSDTFAEACITSIRPASTMVDTGYNSAATPFILGIPRSVQKSPYRGVNEWGAYLRFDDYNSATLFYDPRCQGAWYLGDAQTGEKSALSALHKTSGTIEDSVRDETYNGKELRKETCNINVLDFCGLVFIGIYISNIQEAELDDQVHTFNLSNYLSSISIVNASTRLSANGSVSGYGHDASLACGWTGTTAFVGLDDGTMDDGFILTIIGTK